MQPAAQPSEPTALYRIHHYPVTLIEQRVLRDGTQLTLRPVLPQDALLLAALIERLSPASRRNRFLGAVKLSAERLMQLACVDYARQMALVVTSGHGADEIVVAEARFCVDGTGSAAEFAVMVDDAWAGRGIGTWLMQALRRAAADAGVQRLRGDVLASNVAMHALMQRCGFDCTPSDDDERLSCVETYLHADEARRAVPRAGVWRRWLPRWPGAPRTPRLA
jgi:acetyltransferase